MSGDDLRARLEALADNWVEDAERLRRCHPHLGTASAAHAHATLLALLVCAHDLRVLLAAEAVR